MLVNICARSYEAESINKNLALIPIIVIVLALAIMLGFGLKGQYVFNPPYLLLVLTLVFYWLVTPVVSYISAKGYLATGSLTLLFVSLAFFIGVPFSIATAVSANTSPNATVTLGALGLLLSSAFQFSGAAQASFGSVSLGSEKRKQTLSVSLFSVLAISVLIILFSLLNMVPPFFVENTGVTLIDSVVYTLVILFFLIGSLLYLRLYLKSKSKLLYMYSLALFLYCIGSFGITQQVVFGDAIVWIGRISTYLGLLYFLLALIVSRRDSNPK